MSLLLLFYSCFKCIFQKSLQRQKGFVKKLDAIKKNRSQTFNILYNLCDECASEFGILTSHCWLKKLYQDERKAPNKRIWGY